MNRWQEAFVTWNAERLNISEAESRERFEASAAVIGHSGPEFDRFGDLSHRIYRVFADDRPSEVLDAYRLHAHLHMLRMLAYPECVTDWTGHPILTALAGRECVRIADLGCGLAQTSLTLATALQSAGVGCDVILADIESVRGEFVRWLAGHLGVVAWFVHCDGKPVAFSQSDVMVATEIFEHLHEPLPYLGAVDAGLVSGGFLLTSLGDHEPGFMHVTPGLAPLRDYLREHGYAEVQRHKLYRKP